MQKGLQQFVIKGTGEVSALDRKIIHYVACTNQPLSIVEEDTFRAFLSSSDRENLKGRKHYTEWAMPRIYAAVKKEVVSRLGDCSALSFTSDIWSGPTESFISLTVHGIDSDDCNCGSGLVEMRASVERLLSNKFNVEMEKIYGLAIFLDPRFKDAYATNKVLFNNVVSTWIQEECERVPDVLEGKFEAAQQPRKIFQALSASGEKYRIS
uniref:Transposase n=1 Tax=Ditylenchus dipsaci TaxID=166011 RepID=A0A915EBD5_9BILA